jgi:tetratricopeptide (TPR) repeat protein
MDTRIIKGLISAAILFWAVYSFVTGSWVSGIFITLLAALSIVMMFRSMRLIMVFVAMRQQKFDRAERWLARISRPDLLWKKQEAYYYYLIGLTASQKQDLNTAEKNFKKALGLGLRMDYDKAIAKLNLSMIALAKNRRNEAQVLIAEVKKLDTKHMLKEQIKMVNDALKKGPQMVHRRY